MQSFNKMSLLSKDYSSTTGMADRKKQSVLKNFSGAHLGTTLVANSKIIQNNNHLGRFLTISSKSKLSSQYNIGG